MQVEDVDTCIGQSEHISTNLLFQGLSQNYEKRVLPSLCLSAWNNSAPTGQIFIKFEI